LSRPQPLNSARTTGSIKDKIKRWPSSLSSSSSSPSPSSPASSSSPSLPVRASLLTGWVEKALSKALKVIPGKNLTPQASLLTGWAVKARSKVIQGKTLAPQGHRDLAEKFKTQILKENKQLSPNPVDSKEKILANLSKEELIGLIKAERDAYKAEDASNRAAVLGDLAEGAKKLKKTETKDKSKRKKKALAKEMQDEKEEMTIDSAHEKVLVDVTKDHKLQENTTGDKSPVSKDELKKQNQAEKQEQKRVDFKHDIQGDHTLKKVDMKEKKLANLSKEELIALIKAERKASNRAAVLGDIAEGARKLKKAETTKDHKLQKTTTVDKSQVSKDELKTRIEAEKQVYSHTYLILRIP